MTEIQSDKTLRIGCLVLAAGGSRRLGKPKQLLVYEGKTLLRRAGEAAINSDCDPVIAVLGSEFKKAKLEIADLNVNICANQDWESGMSSSIKAGLKDLLRIEPNIDAVLITLCDQPKITSQHLHLFVERFEKTKATIVAARYNGVIGVPTLFSKELFDDLSKIEGDKGAKELIRNAAYAVEIIDLPEAAFDIDTSDDADRLVHN